MKTKLFMIFLLGILLPLFINTIEERKLGQPRKLYQKHIRHHRNKKHHRRNRNHHNKKHRHRALKRKIYKNNDELEENDELKDLSEATKIGFKQGLKYAKRYLNTENPEEDHSHYDTAVGSLGGLGFLAGTYKKNNKRNEGDSMEKIMKTQFAFKDSVIRILSKEIQDLGYLNQKLGSAGRRIGSTESNMMQRLQEKIFQLYSHKQNM